MSTETLLTTVLGLYQDVHDTAQTERILGSTTTLLANLTNPLNLSLLTSQLLTAPAIWGRSSGLDACMRIISIYNTAAIHVRRNELDNSTAAPHRIATRRRPGSEEWARAVVKGADDRSARWQHLLVLTGVLMGLEGNDRRSLSRGMRSTLEQGVVTAANLALDTQAREGGSPLAAGAIVLALNYAFPLLSEGAKSTVNCDALLPLSVRAMTGEEGFQGGLVLDAINADSRLLDRQLHWPEGAASFRQLQQLESRPLVANAGPLSKLVVYAIEHAKVPAAVLAAQDVLVAFTEVLALRWTTNTNLSGFDTSVETVFLSPDTAQKTWPILWQHLRKILYATVVVLQAVLVRSLLDPRLRADAVAPSLAAKALHIFRNLYFISSRQGASSFQVYTFTYLASIDILVRYPEASTSFLRSLLLPNRPTGLLTEASRSIADLFYLNVAEHFAISLPPETCDTLIVQPAMRYLTPATQFARAGPVSPRMMEIFEAAHSAVLAVLSCPHTAPVTVGLAPSYAEALFSAFPSRISPRQFRVAFKTMMQVLSPPFPISATHPALAETLLEMVRMRAAAAGTAPLAPSHEEQARQLDSPEATAPGPMSEQSALVLTMIDALPFLSLAIVEEWMTVTAETLSDIADPALREVARRRFWEVLVSGEMDVERAAIGVAWWGTKGGGELVLHGRHGRQLPARDPFLMSGAILEDERGASRL